MLGPAELFKYTTTGTRNEAAEVEHEYDVGCEHGHEAEGREECDEAELVKAKQQCNDEFNRYDSRGDELTEAGEQGRLAELHGELLVFKEFGQRSIDEEHDIEECNNFEDDGSLHDVAGFGILYTGRAGARTQKGKYF